MTIPHNPTTGSINFRHQVAWQRSSLCGNAGCIEVASASDEILIRDSKRDDSPILEYTREEWRVFLAGVKAGEFDHL